MKKYFRPLLTLATVAVLGAASQVCGAVDWFPPAGYGNDALASQIAYDSFRSSVRKRFETARVGNYTQQFGNYSSTRLFSSDNALAMAPSSRSTSYSSARRRQLDCVYSSGFTVWADMYQTWAGQSSRGDNDGYRYRITGPALGFDWSNGPVTIGIAGTYAWGKMKSRDFDHDRKTRTWALSAYGQYDAEMFYINATIGYARNRFKSSRYSWWPEDYISNHDTYHANAWNLDAEFGWKFAFGDFKVVPNIGIRYFHDRRDSITEKGETYLIHGNSRNYHSLEMPVGVNLSYEIRAGGTIIVPRFRAAWIPELSRKKTSWSGTYTLPIPNTDPVQNYAPENWGERNARRARHGFLLGAGLEAKITKSLSAHIDYYCNFRSKAYEHHWNAGLGFTF